MKKRLSVVLNDVDGWSVAGLTGPLHEGVAEELGAALQHLTKHCIFDLRGVASVNSCGIAEWIEFLESATPKRRVVFDACSPSFVTAMNMIPAMRRGAEVRSVCRPYSCTNGHEEWQLVRFDVAGGVASVPAPTQCAKCGALVEARQLDEEYFLFLQGDGE